MKKLRIGILLIILSGAAFCFFLRQDSGIRAETVTPERQDVEDLLTEEGIISAGDTVLYPALVTGAVEEICVEENQRVRKGELLFRISESGLKAEKLAAESKAAALRASLQQAEISQLMTASPTEYLKSLEKKRDAAVSSLNAAQSNYEAGSALVQTGAMSRNSFSEAEAAYRSAVSAAEEAELRYQESRKRLKELESSGVGYETINSRFYESETERINAEIRAAEAGINYLAEQLQDCRVTAKEDGIVTTIPVKDLTWINEGQPALSIVPEGRLLAEADVLTSAAPYIHEGDPVTAELSLRGKNVLLKGVVKEVYDYAEKRDSALGLSEYRVHVKAELDGEGTLAFQEQLPHGIEGYGADLTFVLFREQQALTLPAGAVFRSEGKDWVYCLRDGKAVRIEVPLRYQTATLAVLEDGFPEDAAVIRDADAAGLYDGAKVRRAKTVK